MSDDERLDELLREAGTPPGPDAATLERLRAHAHAQWRASLERPRPSRWWAMAASVLLVLAATLPWVLRSPAVPEVVAHVVSPGADVLVTRASRGGRALPSDALAAGDEMTLRAHAVALRPDSHDAPVVRVDAGSRLRWRSASEVELLAGRLYVDSDGAAGPLEIVVGRAHVHHLGTQYLVARAGDSARVLVREGRVRVALGDGAADLERGQAATFAVAGGPIRSGSASLSGADWRWAESLSPRLLLEGRDLASVLAELARETGRVLRFASPDAERQARETILHGPALDMAPADALATLLSSAGFTAVPEGNARGELVIALR